MTLEVRHGFSELVQRVARRTPSEGRNPAPVSGVWLNRYDRPAALKHGRVPGMTLAVVVQGQKRVDVGGRSYLYDPQRYLVLTEEATFESRVLEASSARPYLSLGVELPPEIVVDTLLALSADEVAGDEVEGDDGRELEPAYVSSLDGALLEPLSRLVATFDDASEVRVVAPLALRELVFRLLRSEAASVLRRGMRRHGDERRIERAMAFIRERASERLTVASIARHVAMSPSHFAHEFRAVARRSPMQYVKHVRLQRAASLLAAGHRASDVAGAVGYGSVSHFTRDFRAGFGASPGAYARQRIDAEARFAGSGK